MTTLQSFSYCLSSGSYSVASYVKSLYGMTIINVISYIACFMLMSADPVLICYVVNKYYLYYACTAM